MDHFVRFYASLLGSCYVLTMMYFFSVFTYNFSCGSISAHGAARALRHKNHGKNVMKAKIYYNRSGTMCKLVTCRNGVLWALSYLRYAWSKITQVHIFIIAYQQDQWSESDCDCPIEQFLKFLVSQIYIEDDPLNIKYWEIMFLLDLMNCYETQCLSINIRDHIYCTLW